MILYTAGDEIIIFEDEIEEQAHLMEYFSAETKRDLEDFNRTEVRKGHVWIKLSVDTNVAK